MINLLTPNDHYSGRAAPLNSKRCILYIYPTNIGTEYFEHGIYSPFFFLQNAVLFHNSKEFGSCIIHILYTECAKIKKNNSCAKRLTNLMHKILFYNKFIICLYMFYMFRALCAHHQEVKIELYSIWYHHTCWWLSGAQVERGLSQPAHQTATYRCDDTRCCIIQF